MVAQHHIHMKPLVSLFDYCSHLEAATTDDNDDVLLQNDAFCRESFSLAFCTSSIPNGKWLKSWFIHCLRWFFYCTFQHLFTHFTIVASFQSAHIILLIFAINDGNAMCVCVIFGVQSIKSTIPFDGFFSLSWLSYPFVAFIPHTHTHMLIQNG